MDFQHPNLDLSVLLYLMALIEQRCSNVLVHCSFSSVHIL